MVRFNGKINTNTNGISIACLNVRGINNNDKKLKKVKKWINTNNFDIILLQEIIIHHESSKKVNIERIIDEFGGNYVFYTHNHSTGILVKNNIISDNITINSNLIGYHWSTWITIKLMNRIIAICSYYNSPNNNNEINENNDNENNNNSRILQLQQQIDEIKQLYNNKISFIIAGDFNCNSSEWDSFSDIYDENDELFNDIKNLIENNNLEIRNNSNYPTHCTKKYNKITKYNIIDLVLISNNIINKTNNYDTTSQMIYEIDSENDNNIINNKNELQQLQNDLDWINNISDHFGINFDLNIPVKKAELKQT
jgi:exonuclease III